jgi:hypothetical protein
MVGTAQERLLFAHPTDRGVNIVGWAKSLDANASGGVPTITGNA